MFSAPVAEKVQPIGPELANYNRMDETTYFSCHTLLGRKAQLEALRVSGTLDDSNYGASWSYDADGNMTSQTDIATGSVTYYTWDYRNRLIEVKQESSSGTVLNDEKFTYDVFNNRIAVSLNGTPELYTVYDGSNPYLDFNGSGQLTERYLTNPNALSQFYGQVSASGTVQWFLTDNINSIRQVVSSSGTVLDAITYDPYGNIISQTNAANAPRFLYAGGAYDSLTGYDQFGRRYYDPSDGRWTSQDPLGFKAGDTDLYRYVFNAPENSTDPNGLCACLQTQVTRKVIKTTHWFKIGVFPTPKGVYYSWTRLEKVTIEIKVNGKVVDAKTSVEIVWPPIWRKRWEGPPKEK